MSLEELKEENAAEEAEKNTESQAELDLDLEAVAEVEAEETDAPGEANQKEAEEADVEPWMQADDLASEEVDKQFTGHDIKRAKDKLKAKLNRKHNEETEALKREVEELKAQINKPTTPQVQANKSRDDFLDESDPEAAYTEYLVSQRIAEMQKNQANEVAQRETQQRQQEAQSKVDSAVDQHYERAAKLSAERNISAEVYQKADGAVRQAIETVMPNQGEMITDQLISKLGEGSEKVMYFLGRNPGELRSLQTKLQEDPSGISAAMHLGTLKTKIAKPIETKTTAPKPAKKLAGGNAPSTVDEWKKKYDKADSVNEKVNIKMDAKRAGVDTKKW